MKQAPAIIRLNHVPAYAGLSLSTIKNLIKRDEFVELVKLSGRARGVFKADLDAWLESRKVKTPADAE